jgi:uncharacterized lipoprotein YajG
MARRILFPLAAVFLLAGCSETVPPTTSEKVKLPPEAEFDPATATKMRQEASKKKTP